MSTDSNDRKLSLLGWLFHLGGLVTLAIGAAAYQFIVSGLITHQQGANEEIIAQLEMLIETDRGAGRQFAALQEDLARLEASAEASRQRIPETPEESEFLARISQAARDKGLAIQNFTRGEVTVLETHSQLQIRLSAEGDYASICGFFAEMASFSRVATVNQMNLRVPADSEVYPLDMTLTLYFGARTPQGGSHG